MRECSLDPWAAVTSMVFYRLGWGHAFVWSEGTLANLSAECRGFAEHVDGALEISGCNAAKGVLGLQRLIRLLPTLLMKLRFPTKTPSPRFFQLRTEGGARAELPGTQPADSPAAHLTMSPERAASSHNLGLLPACPPQGRQVPGAEGA